MGVVGRSGAGDDRGAGATDRRHGPTASRRGSGPDAGDGHPHRRRRDGAAGHEAADGLDDRREGLVLGEPADRRPAWCPPGRSRCRGRAAAVRIIGVFDADSTERAAAPIATESQASMSANRAKKPGEPQPPGRVRAGPEAQRDRDAQDGGGGQERLHDGADDVPAQHGARGDGHGPQAGDDAAGHVHGHADRGGLRDARRGDQQDGRGDVVQVRGTSRRAGGDARARPRRRTPRRRRRRTAAGAPPAWPGGCASTTGSGPSAAGCDASSSPGRGRRGQAGGRCGRRRGGGGHHATSFGRDRGRDGGGEGEEDVVERAGVVGGLEPGRGVVGDEAAAVQHGDGVGELVGLLQVLGGQQHARAGRHEGADLRSTGRGGARVQAGRGLVQEHDPGPLTRVIGQVELAAHAARQLLTPACGRRRQAEARDQLCRARRPSARGRWNRAAMSRRFSVTVSRASTAESWPVTPISRRTACGSRGDVVAQDAGGAAVGRQQRGQDRRRWWSCRRRWGPAARSRSRRAPSRSRPSSTVWSP